MLQIALAWGIGVTLAIYLTRHLSCAHLNPAVSFAMVIGRRMGIRKLPYYLLAQFSGAIIAGLIVYLLFAPSIAVYENSHGIVRGALQSVKTAMMFGEFYPNPGSNAAVTLPLAITAEAVGTFLLVLIFSPSQKGAMSGVQMMR